MYLYEKLQRMEEEKENEKKLEDLFSGKIPASHKPLINNGTKYVALMSSMSHTYGNALAFIQNWVLNLFPKDLFKTIHVSSKIAHRQIRSTNHEFLKKSKSMIIFRPRIPTANSEDVFLKGTPLIEKQTDLFNTWGATNLEPFIEDPNNDYSVKYQLNRTVMYVDVIVVLPTLMQQLDYMHYLENTVRINHPFFLQTCLESYIPQDMIDILSKLSNQPVYDSDNSTKSFMTYLNGHSIYPITYKLQGSSRSKEFYRYYPVNIDTIITDLDKDDGERVGHVADKYQLNFSIRMEFYSTGFYYIFSNNIYDIGLPKVDIESSRVIPMYTDVLLKEDLNLDQGWSVYNRASCVLDNPEDTVNFNELLNNSIRQAIKYYNSNGLPLEEFLDIKIRQEGIPIKDGTDYSIDYDKKIIKFYRANTFYTYSIIICINVEIINTLIKNLLNLK